MQSFIEKGISETFYEDDPCRHGKEAWKVTNNKWHSFH